LQVRRRSKVVNAHEPMAHEQAAELLPWLVNESLPAEEIQSVLEHARACVICRRELDDLERVRASIENSAAIVPAPDMRNINARIDRLIDRQNWGREWILRVREALKSPWRIAFVAQSLMVVVLASLLLWLASDNSDFTTLTEPSGLPPGTYVRVVFSPEIAKSELAVFLDRFELNIVDGPSNRGVYTLGLSTSMSLKDRDNLVLFLQGDPRILFAQPVLGGPDQ